MARLFFTNSLKEHEQNNWQEGISQIKAFIFSESYHIEKAIVHFSKAAYLSKLIEYGETNFVRFNDPMEIQDWVIEQPFYTRLNKLKNLIQSLFFTGLGFMNWT